MNATTNIYTIKSIKTAPETRETLDAAIDRAREINDEYQPSFGVQIEDAAGETVWDSEEAVDSSKPTLMNYATGEAIRNATAAELEASKQAAERDGGAGVITVDGVDCYVEE